MFRGLTVINLDEKGRISIPSRYRELVIEEAGGVFVCTISTDEPCLLLYPLPEWEIIEQKLSGLPSFDPTIRQLQRLLLGHATEMEMDGQGRCLLPLTLRDYANLNKKVMLVGQGKKFELWDEERWIEGRSDWLSTLSDNKAAIPEALRSFSL